MPKVKQEPERIVTIRSGKKKETFKTWQYWEIVGALQWMGADRLIAYDTAKLLLKAAPGYMVGIPLTDITLEVTERETHC